MQCISLLCASASLIAFQTCEVVTIETENGPVRINKSEFDPEKHKLVDENAAPELGSSGGPTIETITNPNVIVPPAPSTPGQFVGEDVQPETTAVVVTGGGSAEGDGGGGVLPQTVTVAPTDFIVIKQGKKFYIATAGDQKKVTGDPRFDESGYASDVEAWNALEHGLKAAQGQA